MNLREAMVQPCSLDFRRYLACLMFRVHSDEIIHFGSHVLGRTVLMHGPVRTRGVVWQRLVHALLQRLFKNLAELVDDGMHVLIAEQGRMKFLDVTRRKRAL